MTSEDRLWIVSRFYAEETGTGYAMTRTAEGLSHYFSVHVLCGQPDYVHITRRAARNEIQNNVTIFRVNATPFSNESLPFKLLNMIISSLQIFFQGLRFVKRNETVLIVNLPPLLPFLALFFCKIRGTKTFLLVHDVYPDSLAVAGILESDSPVIRALNYLFKIFYRGFDRIVVLGRDMQKLIADKLDHDSSKIVVIPNTADIDEIYPTPRHENVLLERLALNGKFVVKYSGHMGRTHGLEILLDAVKKMSVTDPGVHFLFVGTGPKRRWLEGEASSNRLNNITIQSFVPREDILDSMNACDVGLISFMPGMWGVSVPSRFYDVIASGKPAIFVGDEQSEIALVIKEEGIGWVIPPSDVDRIIGAILEAKQNPELLFNMGVRCRLVAEEKYARSHQIQSYRRLFSKVAE